jgi:hypothetical protein
MGSLRRAGFDPLGHDSVSILGEHFKMMSALAPGQIWINKESEKISLRFEVRNMLKVPRDQICISNRYKVKLYLSVTPSEKDHILDLDSRGCHAFALT